MSLFGAAATGRDVKGKADKKKRQQIMVPAEEVDGIALAIDFPTEEGWSVIHHLNHEDWKRVAIDPDNVSPAIHRQLVAAHGAEYGTPVLCRVLGDAVAVLSQARYFAPGESDDREEGDFDCWRIEWFGDGIKRVKPDNTSWWQHRLKYDPKDRENAFAAQWLHENDGRSSFNFGNGIAQDLMLSTYEHEKPKAFEPWITNRERKILATFVQWLGTNCGQAFLYEVARRGGIPKGILS